MYLSKYLKTLLTPTTIPLEDKDKEGKIQDLVNTWYWSRYVSAMSLSFIIFGLGSLAAVALAPLFFEIGLKESFQKEPIFGVYLIVGLIIRALTKQHELNCLKFLFRHLSETHFETKWVVERNEIKVTVSANIIKMKSYVIQEDNRSFTAYLDRIADKTQMASFMTDLIEKAENEFKK